MRLNEMSMDDIEHRFRSGADLTDAEVIMWCAIAAGLSPGEAYTNVVEVLRDTEPDVRDAMFAMMSHTRAEADAMIDAVRKDPSSFQNVIGPTNNAVAHRIFAACNAARLEMAVGQFDPGAYTFTEDAAIKEAQHWFSVGMTEMTEGCMRSAWERLSGIERMIVCDANQGSRAATLGAWFRLGLPTVDLHGHRYAAAMMSTRISEDIVVEPPWRAFMLRLPDGLVQIDDGRGHTGDVQRVFVNRFDGRGYDGCPARSWHIVAESSRVMLTSIGITQAEMIANEREWDEVQHGVPGAWQAPRADSDNRVRIALSRLVLGVCLAFDAGEYRHVSGSRGKRNRPPGVEPKMDRYVVGGPIDIDCRSAVSDFLAGKRSEMRAAQWLVRGHWRNQACGPDHADRRPTWIKPYWKGPLDAPVLIKSYEIGGVN